MPEIAEPVQEPDDRPEGAQWDEVHRRWERWDDSTNAWVALTEGDGVPIDQEVSIPPLLARELQHADDLPEREHVPDLERRPEPPTHVKGAQWNELEARWERWDETADAWVAVEADGDAAAGAGE